MNDSNTEKFAIRKKGSNPFDDAYMNYGKQVSSNADLNIWSYIGPFGKGELYVAENMRCFYSDGNKKENVTANDLKIYRCFDGPSYLHLLKYRALPLIQSKVSNDFVFIQDNASIHLMNKKKAEYSVFDLFKEKSIEVEEWPARSPDLSRIENC